MQRAMPPESRNPVELGPQVAERMMLEASPGAAVVGCFVMSRGAQRAWEAINEHLHASRGALFWIGGPGGCGKTHFLNYVVALSHRAGALSAEHARYLTFALDTAGAPSSSEVNRRLVDLIARELAGDSKAVTLWRRMSGEEALPIALDHARRQGVKAITVAIDFGDTLENSAAMAALAQTALSAKNPRLTVVAAGRGEPLKEASFFNIAPERDEEAVVAVGRARRLAEGSSRAADAAYRAIDTGDLDPRQIFPFHPGALDALAALNGGIPAMAEVACAAVERWMTAQRRLIFAADLMLLERMRQIVEMRLDDAGRAALALGYAAAEAVDRRAGGPAREMVDVLMLRSLAGEPPLAVGDLARRVLSMPGSDGPSPAEILTELASRSRGVIVLDAKSDAASFDAAAAGAPWLASFSAASDLIRKFDSTLEPARDVRELKALIRRLGGAMADALERACRNREILAAAIRESGGELSPAQERTFADFCALAEAGARALIETGADARRRADAIRTVAEYESLAALAAAVPRVRSMREYLYATGLRTALEQSPTRERRLIALETECQLLLVSANPATLADARHGIDALEARFQQFKWTYVRHYRSAHEKWRLETERVAAAAADARHYLEALRHLNSIPALGPSEGDELRAQLDTIERRAARCDPDGPLSPEITPRCPRCGYVLGTEPVSDDLNDLVARARRALRSKLAILSRGAIRRLIREHDRDGRLEGFLKITQATQTDALARMVDGDLARYLARLIEENTIASQHDARATVRKLTLKRRASARSVRRDKSPPDDPENA